MITTNSYHFCKLSLVKKPSSFAKQVDDAQSNCHKLVDDTSNLGSRDGSNIPEGSLLAFINEIIFLRDGM